MAKVRIGAQLKLQPMNFFLKKNIDQHLNHFVLLKQLSICEPNDWVTSTRLIGIFETPSCGAWHVNFFI